MPTPSSSARPILSTRAHQQESLRDGVSPSPPPAPRTNGLHLDGHSSPSKQFASENSSRRYVARSDGHPQQLDGDEGRSQGRQPIDGHAGPRRYSRPQDHMDGVDGDPHEINRVDGHVGSSRYPRPHKEMDGGDGNFHGRPRTDGHVSPSRHPHPNKEMDGVDGDSHGRKRISPLVDGDSDYDGLSSENPHPDSFTSESPLTSPEMRRARVIVDGVARKPSKRVRGGEDNLTVRRREANRLAAQRFRSRKKGYQDSLEDRIKVLEHEKELMVRHSDEFGHSSSSSLPDRSSSLRHMSGDGHGEHWHHSTRATPNSLLSSTSPDQRDNTADAEVRLASLESANRRLQEEVRGLYDANAHLRDELQWRSEAMTKRIDHDGVDGDHSDGHSHEQHEPKNGRRNNINGDVRRQHLPSLDIAALGAGSYPAAYAQGFAQKSPLDSDLRLDASATSGMQLPPLRWPPSRSGGPSSASANCFSSLHSSPPRHPYHSFEKPR